MKHSVFLLMIFCCFLNFAVGLKCVRSAPGLPESSVPCLSTEKYCFTFNYKLKNTNAEHTGTVQGCSGTLTDYDGNVCTKTGSSSVDNDLYSGSLYCCNKDLCNSSTTFSFVGIITSVLVVKFLLF